MIGWLFPAVGSQSETEQMMLETGSAPITEDLEQQEAGPVPTSPAPKASQGQLTARVWPRGPSADPGRLFVSAEPPGESPEQSHQQGELERDAAKRAPPDDGTKVRLLRVHVCGRWRVQV